LFFLYTFVRPHRILAYRLKNFEIFDDYSGDFVALRIAAMRVLPVRRAAFEYQGAPAADRRPGNFSPFPLSYASK
jgi:hypothetical protein